MRFRLRDTFAGKNLTEIWRAEIISEKISKFYRQKCRAAAEIMGTWEGHGCLLCFNGGRKLPKQGNPCTQGYSRGPVAMHVVHVNRSIKQR